MFYFKFHFQTEITFFLYGVAVRRMQLQIVNTALNGGKIVVAGTFNSERCINITNHISGLYRQSLDKFI